MVAGDVAGEETVIGTTVTAFSGRHKKERKMINANESSSWGFLKGFEKKILVEGFWI